MCVGLVCESLLNEFHPNQIIYKIAVERLVRQLLVIEKTITLDKAERGKFILKKLCFRGIRGGFFPKRRSFFSERESKPGYKVPASSQLSLSADDRQASLFSSRVAEDRQNGSNRSCRT